jgi:N6-adenosine-specific RNA methylase IME4
MSGLANQHYSTMPLNELKQLKVEEIAAKDCILFLWTTGPQMKNSIELMNAWGFEYKTMFMTWIKTTSGEIKANRLGFYTRQSCEYVLMGSRGNVLKYKNPKYTTAVCNVFEEDSQEHSRKPKYVRELIDNMFCNVPKTELFSRDTQPTLDWDYWGNEVGEIHRNLEWKERREEQRQLYEERSKIKREKKSSSPK